jgi:hypothetical protein
MTPATIATMAMVLLKSQPAAITASTSTLPPAAALGEDELGPGAGGEPPPRLPDPPEGWQERAACKRPQLGR